MKRSWWVGSLVPLLLMAACGGTVGGSGPASGSPVTVALVSEFSGSAALNGEEASKALTVGFDIINKKGGVLGGRPLKYVEKDDQYNPTVAIQDFHEMHSSGINIGLGFGSSAECQALEPVAEELNIVYLTTCTDPSLLTTNKSPNFFMISNSNSALTATLGQLAKAHYSDIPTWDIYSLDYVTGKNMASMYVGNMQRQVPNATIGTTVYAPLTATDVRSYISTLEASAPVGSNRGLLVYAYASNGIVFLKQAVLQGLFSHYKAVLWDGGNDDALTAVGASAPNAWIVSYFMPQAFADNALWKEFAQAYKAKWGSDPTWASGFQYEQALALKAGVDKANSTDTAKLIKALRGLKFSDIKGSVSIRSDDNLMISPATYADCQGDASAPNGWSCKNYTVVPADKITPAVGQLYPAG